MTFYIIILFLTLFIVFWLVLVYPPRKSAAILINTGPLFLIVTGGLLTVFRRGAIGVPMIVIGLSWWRRIRAARPAASRAGRTSNVRSKYLEMELDHDTGEMDGRIVTGSMEGVLLSSLSKEQILTIYRDICSDDDSCALLESYLDRYHPDWREHVDTDSFSEQRSTSGFEQMSKEQAYQILGLEPGASQQQIHEAWRRLIKGVHPDGGGSAFLTAKINAARDVLMD